MRHRTTALLWRVGLAVGLVCGIGLLPTLSRTDPALTVLKARSADRDPTPEVLAAVRGQLGLDASPLTLLGRWVGGLWRGDAGQSWISGDDVTPAVLQALGASLLLMAAALAVAALTATAVCARTLWLGARLRLDARRPGGTRAHDQLGRGAAPGSGGDDVHRLGGRLDGHPFRRHTGHRDGTQHRTNRRGYGLGGRGRLGQLGESEFVAHFPHELGHPYVQRVADGGKQLGGCLLLPPLHLGEIAE